MKKKIYLFYCIIFDISSSSVQLKRRLDRDYIKKINSLPEYDKIRTETIVFQIKNNNIFVLESYKLTEIRLQNAKFICLISNK